eukprot:Hpha_TRINITY_DN1341_c0_g1::TRINITY_DN1341_c0_g1_i1::g.93323::m.93323/K02183/CALM; calmodulin
MAALQQQLVMRLQPQGVYAANIGNPYSGGYSTSAAPAAFSCGHERFGRTGHNRNRIVDEDEMQNNIGGLMTTDKQLRDLFEEYDVDKSGYLDKVEVKRLYSSFENFGVDYTDEEIDAHVSKYAIRDDGKVTFDEFCAIVLSIVNR